MLDDSMALAYRQMQPEPERFASRCGSNSALHALPRTEPTVPLWHIAQTHPKAERWAASQLQAQGYPVYLPLCVVLRRDRVLRTLTRPVEVPLWPSYVLVQFSHADPWGPVQHTRGVTRLLMSAPLLPHVVPDGLVATLQATEDARRTLTPPEARWRPGMACTVSTGPFRNVPGVVVATARQHLRVSLVMLGALREVTVAPDALAARLE